MVDLGGGEKSHDNQYSRSLRYLATRRSKELIDCQMKIDEIENRTEKVQLDLTSP